MTPAKTNSRIHFASGKTLEVVETTAQIYAGNPGPSPQHALPPPYVTTADGAIIWLNSMHVEYIEPLA